MPVVALVGGMLTVFAVVTCVGCSGVLRLVRGPNAPPDQAMIEQERRFVEDRSPDPGATPARPVVEPRETVRSKKPDPVRETPDQKEAVPKPVDPLPDPSPEPAPEVVELAPPPRLLPPNRPPTGFASRWDQQGLIQTRVVGATVMRPVLVEDDGEESPAPEPMLVIWVETRGLPGARTSLRRWQGTFNDSITLADTDGTPIAPAKLPTGCWLGGQLKGDHSLKPGGPGVVDALAFKLPPASARNLWLELGASHVRESGKFLHTIPYSAWARR